MESDFQRHMKDGNNYDDIEMPVGMRGSWLNTLIRATKTEPDNTTGDDINRTECVVTWTVTYHSQKRQALHNVYLILSCKMYKLFAWICNAFNCQGQKSTFINIIFLFLKIDILAKT